MTDNRRRTTNDKTRSGIAEIARSQFDDSVDNGNRRTLFIELRSRAVGVELPALRRMPEMDDGQVTERPYLEGLRSLPELVVLASPADERLVHAADLVVSLPCDGDASASFQVLHDNLRRPLGKRFFAGEQRCRMCFTQVEDETFEVHHLIAVSKSLEHFFRIIDRHEHVVVVKHKHFSTRDVCADVERPRADVRHIRVRQWRMDVSNPCRQVISDFGAYRLLDYDTLERDIPLPGDALQCGEKMREPIEA